MPESTRKPYRLQRPCSTCRTVEGYIKKKEYFVGSEKKFHITAYCATCDKYQKHVPQSEIDQNDMPEAMPPQNQPKLF